MKPRISTPALVRFPHEAGQWIVRRLAGAALLALSTTSAPAYPDGGAYDGYQDYYNYTPQRYVVPAPAYTYDAVNRRSSLTPEPVWRSMFPSARERSRVEEYNFGVPGHSEQELRYWERHARRYRR